MKLYNVIASAIIPISGVVTQHINPNHVAVDIACMIGEPVVAVHDGIGSRSRSHTHGNVFTLTHESGLVTSYSHLETAEPNGTYKKGDKIGTCGNTGTWSTGPHLHFESSDVQLLFKLYSRY
jgi:murein DD-endopeptidase MepM/ murein hydrolase activator NlpD